MTKKMDGEIKLQEHLTLLLNSFNERIKLYENTCPIGDIKTYVNAPLEQIKQYDAESCFEVATSILSYVLYLQRVINRERATVVTLDSAINAKCAQRWSQFATEKFKPKEIVFEQIIADDKYLVGLDKARTKSKLLLEETYGIISVLQKSADTWKELGKAKKYG